jgi:hypothetical protein
MSAVWSLSGGKQTWVGPPILVAIDPSATSRFSGKANHEGKNERFCQSELGETFFLISVCAPVTTTKFR